MTPDFWHPTRFTEIRSTAPTAVEVPAEFGGVVDAALTTGTGLTSSRAAQLAGLPGDRPAGSRVRR
jgi:hypothetical protein